MLQKSVNWVNSLTNKGFMPCESVFLNLTACSIVISELVHWAVIPPRLMKSPQYIKFLNTQWSLL